MKRTFSPKSWLRLARFWDALFALCEDGLRGVRQSLTPAGVSLFRRKASPKRRPYLPAVEGLELRQVPSTFRFLQPSYSIGERDGYATVGVERTGSAVGSASVSYGSADGTAVGDYSGSRDYEPTYGTLYFADGQATATFSVPVHDALVEGQGRRALWVIWVDWRPC